MRVLNLDVNLVSILNTKRFNSFPISEGVDCFSHRKVYYYIILSTKNQQLNSIDQFEYFRILFHFGKYFFESDATFMFHYWRILISSETTHLRSFQGLDPSPKFSGTRTLVFRKKRSRWYYCRLVLLSHTGFALTI